MRSGNKVSFARRLTALIVFTIIATPALAQQGWVAVRIAPAGQELNTVFFLDSKRGWAGGDNGFMVRTEDGGVTWISQKLNTSDAINDIYFRDKERGFLIAGNVIYTTEDNGIRWGESRRFAPAEFDGAVVELYCIRFSSKKKGWVVGSISKRDRVIDSILVYTDNGGETWTRQRTPSSSELIHVDFDNDRRGWIVGAGGTILHTNDAGDTWIRQTSGTTATLYHVDFRNDKRGLAVGAKGTILRTVDGGSTWTPVTNNVAATLWSVVFVNEDEGWAVGRGGAIVRSSDGGLTWLKQESSVTQNLYALHFQKKIGWAVGGDGMLVRYER
jgi:photosystem II stability/assembly factor-like uncharacterized protein